MHLIERLCGAPDVSNVDADGGVEGDSGDHIDDCTVTSNDASSPESSPDKLLDRTVLMGTCLMRLRQLADEAGVRPDWDRSSRCSPPWLPHGTSLVPRETRSRKYRSVIDLCTYVSIAYLLAGMVFVPIEINEACRRVTATQWARRQQWFGQDSAKWTLVGMSARVLCTRVVLTRTLWLQPIHFKIVKGTPTSRY